MKKLTRLCAVLVAALSITACVGGAVQQLDVAAQRAEQAAITVDWLRYVDADPQLGAEQRARRHRTAAAQDLRIRKLEEAQR